MVSERDITMAILLDTTDIWDKLRAATDKADEIARKEAELRIKVAQTAQKVGQIARSFVSLFKNVLTIMGVTLDATSAAMVVVIEQIIGVAVSWFALQAAIASAPVVGQIIAGFSLGMAALALGVAIAQGIGIAQGREALTTKVNAAIGALGNLEGIGRGLANL